MVTVAEQDNIPSMPEPIQSMYVTIHLSIYVSVVTQKLTWIIRSGASEMQLDSPI